MGGRSAQKRAVISRAFRNRSLRRVELAYGLFVGAEWAVWIAFLVYGYIHGGASGATTIALLQVVPTALLAPVLGMLSNRHGPKQVLLASYLGEAASMASACALIAVNAPRWTIFALSVLVSVTITLGRPTQAALMPAIVRTPDELTASNVLAGWSESAWKLIAPALVGILLAWHGPAPAVAGTALMALIAALLVAAVPGPARPQASGESDLEFRASISVVVHDPALRVLLGAQGCYQVVVGVADFLMVILALSILHIGQGGAGYLTAVLGVGGLLAGSFTVGLIGRSNLARIAVISLLSANVALAALGFNKTVVLAFLLLGGVGFCGGLFDVTARTLLQRAAPPESLASSFSVLESLMDSGLALGVIIVRASVAIGGDGGAFWIPGLVGVVVIIALSRRLVAIDRSASVPHVQIELLRSTPIFSSLSGPALEGVAHQLVPVSEPSGAVVIREGDPGDRYYVIADGTLAVSRGGRHVATLGRGQGFGEIALLSDSPRTSSVTACSDVLLYALDKDPFVLMLTGHPVAHDTARTIATTNLRSLGMDEPAPED